MLDNMKWYDWLVGIAFLAIAWFFGYKAFMYLVKFCSFMLDLIFTILDYIL
jgi:hypothetical protein